MDSWIRYIHVVINVLFMATGLLLIGFGLFIRFASGTQELLSSANGNTVVIFAALSIGFVIFVVGTCGSVGFCYKSRPLLLTYMSVNVIFVVIEVGVVIFVVIDKDHLNEHLKPVWNQLGNDTKNLLQDRFNCCGYASPEEWGNTYPRSCIDDSVPRKDTVIWHTTCYDAIINFLKENMIIAGAVIGIAFLLQVFEVVIVYFLLQEVKDREEHSGGTHENRHFDKTRRSIAIAKHATSHSQSRVS